MMKQKTQEGQRLDEMNYLKCFMSGDIHGWDKWGPYPSERGWGTVREDYSADGEAWDYFTHDQARMRAYRRSEDGIAGYSDRFLVMILAPAFWNGQDPILKERLFGLNSKEGNHGEDVKEYYYYLDATPTHSYLKYLYKYPQKAYPYEELLEGNRNRGVGDREFELIDTGIFDDNRYFDIFIEYAKVDKENTCVQIEAFNRGPDSAPLHILPQLWFRNQWAWGASRHPEPSIHFEKSCFIADDRALSSPSYLLTDYHLGKRYLYVEEGGDPLFTHNDTNKKALWQAANDTPFVKDAFHRYLIQNEKGAINPQKTGTKAAIHYFFPSVPSGKSVRLRLRLSDQPIEKPLDDVESIIAKRKKEADEFFKTIHPASSTAEEKEIQRQAFAGMIWNKQAYLFDVSSWLEGDNPNAPPPPSHKKIRNTKWRHLFGMRIFSMPDKWEYPWFAAWDLTFHTLVIGLMDIAFAKQQLWLLLFDQYQHPNGAIPAYEWEFSDVNPPVQAFAALRLYELEKTKWGREDLSFLERCFHKLLLNFSWWINKIDKYGNNVFEGGFLGMDNIGLTDRSKEMEPGYELDQADGSGWMGILCLNMMRIALTLAKQDIIYESLGIKFLNHFMYIGAAMRNADYRRHYDLWCDTDGFFYSVIRGPNKEYTRVPIRSLVGLIPLFSCDVWDEGDLKSHPEFYLTLQWLLEKKPNHVAKLFHRLPNGKILFGLMEPEEIKRVLEHVWNPNEFRSEYGLRSVSKFHAENPIVFQEHTLRYEPGEALERLKGGNSNWRGPIWFPLNYLLIQALQTLGEGLGDKVKIKTGKEKEVTLCEMADSFRNRLIGLFKKNEKGQRPFFGENRKLSEDPHFQNYFFFNEHFHGDTGRGLGASHQNGWTGLVANLIDESRK